MIRVRVFDLQIKVHRLQKSKFLEAGINAVAGEPPLQERLWTGSEIQVLNFVSRVRRGVLGEGQIESALHRLEDVRPAAEQALIQEITSVEQGVGDSGGRLS